MSKILIYSCVFFNEKYIELISLLLKTYKLYNFGDLIDKIDYLIICNHDFRDKIQNIFDMLKINGKIWCLELDSIFEAGYSRLKIFDYFDINNYNKILYLDCDILITNNLQNLLKFDLEDKIYCLKEGNTNHDYWGRMFFENSNQCVDAFTSGILLFNNTNIIKELFDNILLHIQNHVSKGLPIPECLDQPFIVYHAVKNNLYNNTKLINLVINNPVEYNNEIISHFPGGPGHYESKITKMTNYINNILFTKYPKVSNLNMIHEVCVYSEVVQANKDFNFLDKNGSQIHLDCNTDYLSTSYNCTEIFCIKKNTLDIFHSIYSSIIPRVIMQTSVTKPENYIVELINNFCPNWKYIHFTDNEIIKYFNDNPISEFPDIVNKFNSFTKGQHKADLFRYYFLYINGGIFLDSDAIFEVNVENIIKDYSCIFVKSFMPNTHLFNGFIATYSKNPIIYEALKHAYYTEDDILVKHYHYFCEELYRIYNRHISTGIINPITVKVYQEHTKHNEGYGGSIILDDINGSKIISHYWESKKIPQLNYICTEMQQKFTDIYDKNFWIKGSGAGSYPENTVEYNKFIIEFIKSNNIKTVIDLGCGDWQSSHLIYNNVDVEYLGIDCVNSVIQNNIKNYLRPDRAFKCIDFINNLHEIKNGDLCIIKDVLQHWELEYIYKVLDYITNANLFKYIIITNNAIQSIDNLELNHYFGIGRGLHSNFLPLKKYNPIHLLDYFGGENKHMCLISKNRTNWNHYNKHEINEFDFHVLTAYNIPQQLIRIGPKTDGGYVIVDNIKYDYFISCGIANDITFEIAFLDKYPNLKCIAFDNTINTFPVHNHNIEWIRKNIDNINSSNLSNLKTYIQDYNNIFLKMDIEGSEFNWIDSMTTEDLNKFSQIIMEVHWPFDKYRYNMLKKLTNTHYIVHVHGNNYCDRDIPKYLPSGRSYDGTETITYNGINTIKLPEVFEITCIRKNLFSSSLEKVNKKYPTELDFPNNPNAKDIEFEITI